jgi:aspartate racemase
MKPLLGIVGGLGPLASAEFLNTIYEFNTVKEEQDYPACVLYSDPTVPDLTQAIKDGTGEMVIERLKEIIEKLISLEASKIVIACITAHYFLPQIPFGLRERIISLIDLVIEDVLKTKKRHLLLCTNGTRSAGIFQNHREWLEAQKYILLPDDKDQREIHSRIYTIKRWSVQNASISYFDALAQKYNADSLIAGCTELHLIARYFHKRLDNNKRYDFVDPLLLVACNLGSLLGTNQSIRARDIL